jgi:hypothetical protein
MAQKLDHYRVVVKKDDGVLVTYDEGNCLIRELISPSAATLY